MSSEQYYIPKYTDEPEMFFFCTIEELAIGAIAFFSFASMGYELTAVFSLIIVVLVMKRLKNSMFKDGFDAFLYWHFPAITPSDHTLPRSCDREYLG